MLLQTDFACVIINVRSVVEFQMVGPKMQAFCHDHTMLKGNRCILRIRGAPVRQKLGMILENKVVQKLEL